MNGPQMEMPKYRCHKEVHALKIDEISVPGDSEFALRLHFEREPFAPLKLTSKDLEGKPTPVKGWYYVVYADGYKSFSPAEAFEEGYTLIPDHVEGSP